METKGKETFSKSEVISEIRKFLEYAYDSTVTDINEPRGNGHRGYFSGPGFAARCLRFHLEELKGELDEDEAKVSPCLAVFHGRGGYDAEREMAAKVFQAGERYRITGGSVGQTRTHLNFEGIDGEWNSVLFEYDKSTVSPGLFTYTYDGTTKVKDHD